MVEAFSEVFHIRQCRLDTPYPPAPSAINPPRRKQSSISTEQPLEPSAQRTDHMNEPGAGYTGELGPPRVDGQIGEAALNPDSASLQWRNVWPE
jgi:hypothetical protein